MGIWYCMYNWLKINKMNLEITREQLDYLIKMIEKDMENVDMDVIHDLYSKLVVLQGNSNELQTR